MTHIENPGIVRTVYSGIISTHNKSPAIFTKIGKAYVTLEIQNPGILRILGYSEPLYLKPDTYSKPFQDLLRWSVLQK